MVKFIRHQTYSSTCGKLFCQYFLSLQSYGHLIICKCVTTYLVPCLVLMENYDITSSSMIRHLSVRLLGSVQKLFNIPGHNQLTESNLDIPKRLPYKTTLVNLTVTTCKPINTEVLGSFGLRFNFL